MCQAQTTVLSEDFEGAFPGAWTTGDANSSGTAAYWRDTSVPFGSIGRAPDDSGWVGYCAGIGYGGSSTTPTYQDSMDGYMSRSINLSGYSSATLTFWYAIPSIESCCDRLEVYIDSTLVWSTGTANPGYWNQVTVDLNNYTGSSHTLKFNFHSDGSVHYEGAYLDNILLTAIAVDTTAPRISAFSVSPSFITQGGSFTINYTTSDAGGSGLTRIELWRAPDNGGTPGAWSEVQRAALSGNGPISGSFSDSLGSPGSYWYGAHVLDNAGNIGYEPNPPGAVKVTVNPDDPNDQISEAIPLGNMTQTLVGTGSIDSATDVDMWSVSVSAGQRISFDIDLPSGSTLDSYIRLFNGSGAELKSSDDDAGPGEASTTESYLEYTFTTGGTYYVGVSGYGNSLYDPITGNGDNDGSTGAYTLTVSPGLTGKFEGYSYATYDYRNTNVDIMRYAPQGTFPAAISVTPGQQTWIIVHGRNTTRWSTVGVDVPRLARAILNQRPNDQVLTLDWSGLAEDDNEIIPGFYEEDWIQPVAEWAASALTSYGFSGSSLNLVGHSWGGNLVDELAERISGGVNTIVALDPAENGPNPDNYNPEDPGQISFRSHSQFSWAFHSSTAGSESTPASANEALIVTNGYDRCDFLFGGVGSAHNSVVNLFSYMLENPSGGVSSLFQLNRLLAHAPGPWIQDRYATSFACESSTAGYEGIITTTTDVQNPQPLTIEYWQAIIEVTVQPNPADRSFNVDGTTYTTAQTFSWISDSSHTISTTSPQSGSSGVQYLWSSWSDGGAISHTITPTSSSTYTVNFATHYYLTMNAGTGGNAAPSSGWYARGSTVQIAATPDNGYTFVGWAGTGSGSYSGNNNPSTVTMNAPITEVAGFTVTPVQVNVQPDVSGRSFSVDGTVYNTAQTFTWASGSSHTITAVSPQSAGPGVQYVWNNWSDGGAVSHTISPTVNSTYTANFATQYYLTMNAAAGGNVTPSSGWYTSGASVPISATANTGYTFTTWSGNGSGSYSGNNNPSSITMNAPITESAAFNPVSGNIFVTVQSSPAAAPFSVDGTSYSSAQTFGWVPGSSHNIGTTSPQSGGTGVQFVWNNWSDGGVISHSIAPTATTTYTANFTTQYYLTMSAGPGGTTTPSSGWHESGTTVPISANPNGGYAFTAWGGTGSGSYSGSANPASVTMNEPITETATFSLPSTCIPPPSGLVAWWPGDGHAFSLRSGVYGGILSNNAGYADALVGKGFSFSGSPDGLIIPDAPALHLESFTIEGWMKRANSSQGLALFACPSGGYGLVIRSIGTIEYVHQDISWITSPFTIHDTDFHHVAVTRSANSIVFYLDGAASPAFDDPGHLDFHGNCGIGNDATLSSNPGGIVDEVAIYGHALTALEIQGIFAAGAKGKCANGLLPRLLPPVRLTDQSVEVKLIGEVGVQYTLLTSPDLVNWNPVATQIASGPVTTFLDPSTSPANTRFYRVAPPRLTDMVWINPGTFTMGSPDTEQDRYSDEGPQTQVTLTHGFFMSEHLVTQDQYQTLTGNNPSQFLGDGSRPVENLRWEDAMNYCGLLTARDAAAGRLLSGWSYRLPTEAEWEYACRAGTATRFFFGDDPTYTSLPNYAWDFYNSQGHTHPVGEKRPNPWGLYDMGGNVWEYCMDWYGSSYRGGSVTDPPGPVSGSYHSMRGGCWECGHEGERSAQRNYGGAPDRYSDAGFRVVLAAGSAEMTLIPAGVFQMGDTFSEGLARELPLHNVFVSSFYIEANLVSTALWKEVYDWALVHGYSFDNTSSTVPNHPAATLNWYDVVKWCNARSEKEGLSVCYYTDASQTEVYKTGNLPVTQDSVRWTAYGYRLPTEAEYEKAMRGGVAGQKYPWGDTLAGNQANYRDSGDPFESGIDQTSPVGYYDGTQTPPGPNMANGYGLYDIAGNLWEWCWDWLDEDWYNKTDATQPDSRGPSSSPLAARVLRGGSWNGAPIELRCAERNGWRPEGRQSTSLAYDFGFRCVRRAGP